MMKQTGGAGRVAATSRDRLLFVTESGLARTFVAKAGRMLEAEDFSLPSNKPSRNPLGAFWRFREILTRRLDLYHCLGAASM